MICAAHNKKRRHRYGHESLDLRITARWLHSSAVELTDLPLDSVARFQERPDRSHQRRTILDQLLDPRHEDIELGTADDETEVLEKSTDMVFEIALDLDQQRPDRVAADILDVTSLNQPVCMMRAIPIASLRSLYLEHRLGMARVDADQVA